MKGVRFPECRTARGPLPVGISLCSSAKPTFVLLRGSESFTVSLPSPVVPSLWEQPLQWKRQGWALREGCGCTLRADQRGLGMIPALQLPNSVTLAGY